LTTDAELDKKLARIGGRIQARADETRSELAAIGCLDLASACKEQFGARLAYLKTPRVELGSDVGRGCVWTVYLPPKVKK
jgi:hypothetical protein